MLSRVETREFRDYRKNKFSIMKCLYRRMSSIVALLLVALCFIVGEGSADGASSALQGDDERYEESLWIRSLPSGHIHTRMEFLIRKDGGDDGGNFHTRLFPRALSEILEAHRVEELQFSLTQGHWRLESWGDPYPVSVAPTGAHVVAWFMTNSTDEG
jgi:hypothetical protein